jgi:hypothetical protein
MGVLYLATSRSYDSFMEHDIDKARYLKLLLAAFGKMSILKINFHKSELFCFWETKEATAQCAELFGCAQGQLPSKYLGILIHYLPPTNVEWKQAKGRL